MSNDAACQFTAANKIGLGWIREDLVRLHEAQQNTPGAIPPKLSNANLNGYIGAEFPNS